MTSILSGRDVDEPQDVALRALRHRQDPRRAPRRQRDRRARVAERQPVRQVLRKHQVDAVVDRHDRPARRRAAAARSAARERASPARAAAPAESSTARRPNSCRPFRRTGRKFGAERRQRARVLRTAEQHELGLVVEPRQLPQQVADVGADAEIVKLPGVDADPHGAIIAGQAGQGGQAGEITEGLPCLP